MAMFFKSKKTKWLFYLSIIIVIVIFLVIRDSGYVPQAFSMHMVSQERRGDRIVVFEERGEFVAPLWERASYYADRRPDEEIPPANTEYFFEIYFSEGQNILGQKGRFVVFPDRLIVDGKEIKQDMKDFFAYCKKVMQSSRSLVSMLMDAGYLEVLEPEIGREIVLSMGQIDLLLEKFNDIEDGREGNAPNPEETEYIFIIPEGEIHLQSDNELVFSFWGGHWHYGGADDLASLLQGIISGE